MIDLTQLGAISGQDCTAVRDKAINGMSPDGGKIYLPSGRWFFSTPHPKLSHVIYCGDGQSTVCYFLDSPMFQATSTLDDLNDITVEDMTVTTRHNMIDVTGGGHFYWSNLLRVKVNLAADDASVVNQIGDSEFLQNVFDTVHIEKPSTSTVPAFNVINTLGGANGNIWRNLWCQNKGASVAPYFHIENARHGQWANQNEWDNCIGENMVGGFIHMYSNNGAAIRNCQLYDASAPYADHIIRFDTSPNGGSPSRSLIVENSGRIGGILAPGKADVYGPPGTTRVTIIGNPNYENQPSYSVPSLVILNG